ncbi:MAG: hypothetical protein FWG83_05150 [Oscillospiraceae bacterium]|nr:hypothetical protein [Oscillospiraceae bacterium]
MKHEKFIYHGYSISDDGFSYHFSMDEYEFRPKWTHLLKDVNVPPNDSLLHELVFNLGMVELVSYWKSACPPLIEVRCGNLDEWQVNWWKKLYRNGLGEFFYTNKITPDEDFAEIITEGFKKQEKTSNPVPKQELSGCLIPVGGGKDSIVTLELLRKGMEDNHCYIIGDIKRACDSAVIAGYPDSRIIKTNRTIDPTLLELNRKGYLNGHTPFSAIVAFSSLIFAYLSGKKYIVLSNESSADEGNIANSNVNHQYSKSTEFERDFREYCARISPSLPEYFSLLRPWNEMQITRKFAEFPKYFPVFQSCNAGTKSNTWCCKCAKCLYVYIMLAAFLESGENDQTVSKIFGENLLENPELSDLLQSLANPKLNKPFECVGTREEVRQALLAILKNRDKIPAAMRDYAAEIKNEPPQKNLLDDFNADNCVPKEFMELFT